MLLDVNFSSESHSDKSYIYELNVLMGWVNWSKKVISKLNVKISLILDKNLILYVEKGKNNFLTVNPFCGRVAEMKMVKLVHVKVYPFTLI